MTSAAIAGAEGGKPCKHSFQGVGVINEDCFTDQSLPGILRSSLFSFQYWHGVARMVYQCFSVKSQFTDSSEL